MMVQYVSCSSTSVVYWCAACGRGRQTSEGELVVQLQLRPLNLALIVIGDPQQLPPTVLSTENARLGWSRSSMERLMRLFGAPFRLLDTQYRMHPRIRLLTFYSTQVKVLQAELRATVADISRVALKDIWQPCWSPCASTVWTASGVVKRIASWCHLCAPTRPCAWAF